MAKYKYPIGTRIRYKGTVLRDVGKEGIIVGYVNENIVWVVVPNSYIATKRYGNPTHSWTTYISNVDVLVSKNQQLLFGFMFEFMEEE